MNILKHLEERYLDLSLYPDAIVSTEENVVTFPLWNLSGQMVGYQQYRPNAPKRDLSLKLSDRRYDTKITRYDNKNVALTAWGLHLLDSKKKYLFVVEGIFDATKLHNMGLNALALLSCNSGYLKSWLWSLGYIIIPICEGDEAGKNLEELSSTGIIEHLSEGKDLGDMTQEEVIKLYSKYIEKPSE